MAFKKVDGYKYYLYISASKLKMLYEQASKESNRKKTFEWGLNLKIASFKSSSARDQNPDRDTMLKKVIEGLNENGQLGTLQEPKSFIRDRFPIRWGFYNDCSSRPDDEPALVYFGGFQNDLLLGMGGSSCHVVGHEGATSTWSRSSTPTLVKWLLSGLQKGKRPPIWDDPQSEESEVFTAMAVAQYYLRPPTQTAEFVAKVITTGYVERLDHFIGTKKARVILATPLYVASTDLSQIQSFRQVSNWGLTEHDWVLEGSKQQGKLLRAAPKEPGNARKHKSEKRKPS